MITKEEHDAGRCVSLHVERHCEWCTAEREERREYCIGRYSHWRTFAQEVLEQYFDGKVPWSDVVAARAIRNRAAGNWGRAWRHAIGRNVLKEDVPQ